MKPDAGRRGPSRAARDVGHRIDELWRSDIGLTALLVFLFCLLLIVPTLLSAGLIPPAVLDVLFSLIVISAAHAVSTLRWVARSAVVLAISAVVVRWLHFGFGNATIRLVDGGLAALTLLFFATLVLGQVLRTGPITLHRVRGAVAAYLLFGFAWSSAYQFVYDLWPAAFRLAPGADPRLELVYFSFVTLTTLGYGDITPLIPAARSLAIAEALIGQLFPAVLIGRLVGMELSARNDSSRPNA